jgi:hypothetical protein
MAAKRFVWMLAALASVLPAAAQNVETDPIRCWWRTSASAIRAGEPFSVVLTCAVVENDAARVVVDQGKLEPSVVQFAPFEVVPSGSAHAPDLRTDLRRFFQYEYRLRLVTENLFGKDVALPETKLSYHVQSQVGQATAIQGRDQSYVLPPLSVRMLSLVPADAGDIRDGTVETFGDVDRRAFRASLLVVAGGVLMTLAGLMALLAVVRLVARYRKPAAATSQLVSDGAILRAVGKELRAVRRGREAGGWTPELSARALGALRIATAYALGRSVVRTEVDSRRTAAGIRQSVEDSRQTTPADSQQAAPGPPADGRLIVRSGWLRRKSIAISASVTPQAVAHAIARGDEPRRAAMLESLEQALARFTVAQYGREPKRDDSALDEALAAARRTLRPLQLDQTWVMKKLARRRAMPAMERRAWSR